MRFSPLVDQIGGRRAEVWQLHHRATADKLAGRDAIVLSVGDPEFATPAPIVEAAITALHAGDTHYSEIAGRPALREAIAAWHSRANRQAVTAENVIVTGGAQNALFSAAHCLLAPGDEIVVPEPMYVSYEASFRSAGATVVTVPQPRERDFRPDPETLRAAITPRTRAIAYASPCNPTGVTLHDDELEFMASLARAHDLWIIADEVYAALAFDVPHRSMAALPGMAERTVTIDSLSKSHAMTGWRIGWAIGPKDLITHMERLALAMLYGIPSFAQAGALAAMASYDEVADEMRAIYYRRRDVVFEAMHGVEGVVCRKPEAGMFVLLDVTASGLTGHDFAERLYDEAGVALLDAGAFGPSCEGQLRFSLTASEETLREACRRIGSFAASLGARAGVAARAVAE